MGQIRQPDRGLAGDRGDSQYVETRPPCPFFIEVLLLLSDTAHSLTRTIHECLLRRPILSPGEAVLVRPHVRVASAGFRLERLATAFMNNPS
mgnify:CR=1